MNETHSLNGPAVAEPGPPDLDGAIVRVQLDSAPSKAWRDNFGSAFTDALPASESAGSYASGAGLVQDDEIVLLGVRDPEHAGRLRQAIGSAIQSANASTVIPPALPSHDPNMSQAEADEIAAGF